MTPMPSVQPAAPDAIDAFLSAHPGWRVQANGLVKAFEAPSFLHAVAFVSQLATAAEEAQHHPDIDIRWRTVTLRWVTHDAGNAISALDFTLAAKSDEVFSSVAATR
jgi:4a-hydroxytetrahydrobiopterin dehydratase